MKNRMFFCVALISLNFLGLAANAAGLNKFYQCENAKLNYTLIIDVRKTSENFGSYTVTNNSTQKIVDSADQESSDFLFLTNGRLRFNSKVVEGPNGILLGLVKQAKGVTAYHYGLRTYFICN